MNDLAPFNWQRGPRSSFRLDASKGVYALFLNPGARLPGITPGSDGLIYIGLAAGAGGFERRCHFNKARTRNHSPRKSLAVLLMEELKLKPVLHPKPNSSDTWGLSQESDDELSRWMHRSLQVAIEIWPDPDARETELVGRLAPPLNLTKCEQSAEHRMISAKREGVIYRLGQERA